MLDAVTPVAKVRDRTFCWKPDCEGGSTRKASPNRSTRPERFSSGGEGHLRNSQSWPDVFGGVSRRIAEQKRKARRQIASDWRSRIPRQLTEPLGGQEKREHQQ